MGEQTGSRSFYQMGEKFVIQRGSKEIVQAEDIPQIVEEMKEKRRVAQEQVKIFDEYIKQLEKFVPIADKVVRDRAKRAKDDLAKAIAQEKARK